MAKRIYLVDGDGKQHLVKAVTKTSAIGHVAKKNLSAVVASQDQLVELTANGVKVEEVGKGE